MAKLINEQNKVEIALGRLDRELNNLSDIHLKRFGFEHESKDDILVRCHGLVSVIKGYENEINRITQEINNNANRMGINMSVDMSFNCCFETVNILYARLNELQGNVISLEKDDEW